MASVGSVYVDLLLRDAKYTEGWNRARGTARSALNGIQSDLNKTTQSFSAMLNPIQGVTAAIQQFGLSLATALSVDKIIKYSDTWRQVSGRLGLVVGDLGDVAIKQEQLFKIAQETRQPLEGIINFYTRLNQFIPEAERAQYDLLGVTQSVASALAITGESAISAQAALIQFTQGIGTNFEAAGQELRSLQELAPRLTQALQSALGDGKKSLQQLVKEGVLTRESVLNALGGMGIEGRKLKEEMAKIPTTVAQAFTQLDNALLKFLGTSSSVTSSTSALAAGIKAVADNLEPLARGLITVAAVAGGATLLKFAQGAALTASKASTAAISAAAMEKGIAAAGGSAVRHAAYLKQAAAAAGSVGQGLFVVGNSGVAAAAQLGVMGRVALSVKTALGGLVSFLGGPLVVAFGAAYLAMEYFADKDSAVVAEEGFRKAIVDTSSEMAAYANQTKNSQEAVKAAAEARLALLSQEEQKAAEALRAYDKLNMARQFSSEFIGTLSKWTGKDLSGLDIFGVGKTREQLQGVAVSAGEAAARVKQIQEDATKIIKVGNDGLGFTKQELEDLKKYAQEYAAQLQGITQEEYNRNKALKELKMLYSSGEFGKIGDPETERKYAAAIDEVNKKYRESTQAYKDAKKGAEELKQIYEEFRPALQGISKEQDVYNENVKKLDRLRAAGTVNEEAYTRALQEQYDILNKTAEKQKEAESTYEKYETYLTGLTEQQIKYNQAQKELQGLVGKDVKGTTISQEQADTALKRYEKSLTDSEDKTKDWAKMVEEMGKRAAENIQDAFADFLYDPFKDGLDGMVVGFANALRKMYAEMLASQLFQLINSGVGESGIGGFISSLFGGTGGTSSVLSTGTSSTASSFLSPGVVESSGINFGSIGMFAEGGVIGPGKWGIAGEAGAELIYGGSTGATVIPQSGSSGGTVVNIINNNGSKVSTSSSKNGNTTTVDVMLDEAVANNMTKTGSRTRQAMGSYNQRSLVRR